MSQQITLTITWRTKVFTIKISKRATVLDLKKAIQQQSGLESDVQKIMFPGRSATDSMSLEELRVVDKQKLMLLATERSTIQQMAVAEREAREKLEAERAALEAQLITRQQESREAMAAAAAAAAIQAEEQAAQIPIQSDISSYSHSSDIANYQRSRGLLVGSNDESSPPQHVDVTLPIWPKGGVEECGNKVLLPTSLLEKLIMSRTPHPYMFEIQAGTAALEPNAMQIDQNKVIVSVLDFTAGNESVLAPQWIIERLGVTEGTPVQLRSVEIPRGQFAVLQPLEFEWLFVPETQRRAVLETQMRNYQAISLGEVLAIQHNNKVFHFEVVDLKPASSVSIIDSDLEVDILPPVDTPKFEHEKIHLPTAEEAGAASSSSFNNNNVDLKKFTFTKSNTFKFYKFDVVDPNLNLVVEVSCSGPFPVAFFLDTKRQFPTKMDNQWSSEAPSQTISSSTLASDPGIYYNPRTNGKMIVLNHKDSSFITGTYYLGIYTFAQNLTECPTQISVRCEAPMTNSDASSAGHVLSSGSTSNGPAPADSIKCDNCQKYVPAGTFAMHSVQCARRNWRCSQCGIVIPVEEKPTHLATTHAKILCDQCGEYEGERVELELHKEYECRARPFECPYCHLHFPYPQRGAHLRECATRTTKCDQCGKIFKNSDIKSHMMEAHETYPEGSSM